MDLGPLGERLGDLGELSDEDRQVVLEVIDGLLARNRLKLIAGGLGDSKRNMPSKIPAAKKATNRETKV